jgi:glycogen synthase
MKPLILTNEYPPHIYGGAGVHVDYLTRELRRLSPLEVRAFAEYPAHADLRPADPKYSKIIGPLDTNLQWAASVKDVSIVHCHTWYSHFGGVLISRLLQVPLVLTTHSLEPHRPWKSEQLGEGGYAMSCWIERTAYQSADGVIAVSQGMKRDVQELYGIAPEKVRVIYNGIDADFYKPTLDPEVLSKYGIDPEKPFVLFVGRITRQKGIAQLIQAIPQMDPQAQVVLCAGAPDTPELAAECKSLIEEVSATRKGVVWISEMVPHIDLRTLYSHASVFVTPSLYEPFGIINLEAMACGTPVVGSAVGGIPEIIVEGETGHLVPLEHTSSTVFEPKDPAAFQGALAQSINQVLASPERAKAMGEAARKRAVEVFSWSQIAKQTFDFYQELCGKQSAKKKC